MTFKPQNSGAALAYLKKRSAEELVRDAARETGRLKLSRDWLTEYHTHGHRTAFNWSPTITGTTIEGATIEENHSQKAIAGPTQEDRGGGQGQLEEAQRGQRRFDRSDGDTPF